MPRKRISPPLELLEQRLEELELANRETSGLVQAVQELRGELEKTRQLALEAVAQAQDARTTSSMVSSFDARLNNLTLAVAEGIQHVERAENRIRATVQRARKDITDFGLEPSPGLEAEAAGLRLADVPRGEERPVHPVREEVGDPDEAVALPGVPGLVRRSFLELHRAAV